MTQPLNPFEPQQREYITVKEFCDRYSVSRSTVAKLLREGQFATIHIGRAVRINVQSIEEYFWRCRERAAGND
jgi:excisionase family DNA binding protein